MNQARGKVEQISTDSLSVYCPYGQLTCTANTYMTFGGVQATNYQLTLSFNLTLTQMNDFDGFNYRIYTADKNYHIFAIALRYILLAISFFASVAFCINTRGCSDDTLREEIKAIAVVSVSLIFYNNPIFILTILQQIITLEVISTLFVTNFYRVLILFWMMFWWKIKYNSTDKKKGSVMVIAWLSSFGLFVLITIQTLLSDIFCYFQPAVSVSWPVLLN